MIHKPPALVIPTKPAILSSLFRTNKCEKQENGRLLYSSSILHLKKRDYRTPKKGLFIALFNSVPAELRIAISTLSRGRNKNSPPSIFSNPHSSRNSIPPFSAPTLACQSTIRPKWHTKTAKTTTVRQFWRWHMHGTVVTKIRGGILSTKKSDHGENLRWPTRVVSPHNIPQGLGDTPLEEHNWPQKHYGKKV